MHPTVRSLPLLVAIFGAWGCASAPPHSSPAGAEGSTFVGTADELQVIPLQYASAMDIAQVLNSSFVGRDVRIQPYQRTNSLIVVGEPSQVALVKELVSQLDVQAKQ